MKKIIFGLFLSVILTGCQSQIRPGIIPTPEAKLTEQNTNALKIIGQIEPIYFPPMESPFMARIDTGAENSSIDVKNLKKFERDGEKWVGFYLINRQTGEKHFFEKKIEKKSTIKRINGSESRYVVEMTVKFGNENITTKFSLADRDKFEYQALVGRNILTGRAIVDTSISNTLH